MKVTDCIDCPKCRKRFLKSQGVKAKFGKEYFCHNCKEYFGVNELVNQWDYDAGDLFEPYPWYIGEMEQVVPIHSKIQKVWFCEYPNMEPNWYSILERDEAYQMVNRMLLGVEEIDEYVDLMNTQNNALQIGVQ